MEFHIHHHYDEQLDRVLRALGAISAVLKGMLMDITTIKSQLQAVTDDVTAEKTVEDSLVTLVTGIAGTVANLQTQLAAALAANDPAALQGVSDGLMALDASLKANAATMAAAVLANTPPSA